MLTPHIKRISSCKMAEIQASKAEWWTTVPAPTAKCPEISGDEVMKLFDDMDVKPGPREFLLVDVRRNDWEVRHHIQCHTRISATEAVVEFIPHLSRIY